MAAKIFPTFLREESMNPKRKLTFCQPCLECVLLQEQKTGFDPICHLCRKRDGVTVAFRKKDVGNWPGNVVFLVGTLFTELTRIKTYKDETDGAIEQNVRKRLHRKGVPRQRSVSKVFFA
ncbi:MAG: hypothetical protein ABJE99_16910 [Roseobacter sp.]